MYNKRIISAVVVLMMAFSLNVQAYKYPNAIWKVNPKFAEAVENNDNYGIIKYGKEIIDIMRNEPECTEKKNTMVSKYREVGMAQVAVGDWAGSATTHREMYEYAKQFGDEFYDDLKMAKARILQYTPVLDVYTDGGSGVFYGAKNEKNNGVLFGVVENGGARGEIEGESMTLLYHELGEGVSGYKMNVIKETAQKGLALEYALNCPNEAYDIANIESKTGCLTEISNILAQYPGMPVYLRFGAEFDVWTNIPDAESYKKAFRYVSDFFESRNPNVAMVWSPNQVAGWYTDTDSFYPGDEYVDWVGVSSYANRYFLAGAQTNERDEIYFKAGASADPVLAIKDIVQKYGDRKPIMLAESGISHTIKATGEDATWWAVNAMKQYYSYIPMVYPQVKLIAYFDNYINGEANDYSLSGNYEVKKEYKKLTKGQRFIKDNYNNNTSFCYRPINEKAVGNVFTVSAYSHMYNENTVSVDYFIDSKFVATSREIPFTAYIDASGFGEGWHALKAVATGVNGNKIESEYNIYINPKSYEKIGVTVNGDAMSFNQEPVVYNDRTMVPMRAIFERLGAEVSWDAENKTAIGRKGQKEIKLTIGSDAMYINGDKKILDTPPIILDSSTLVPARAVAEGLDCQVGWDKDSATVIISE